MILIKLFASTLFVLNMAGEKRHHDTTVYAENHENNYIDSMFHTYLISFAEFDMDGYENRGKYYNAAIWICFFIATIMI